MQRFILEQSDSEFYTSHSGLALVGACINRYSELGHRVNRKVSGSDHIAEIDILRSYLGLLCMGKSDFQAIAGMREDVHFRKALGIERIPSAERMRQRLDEAGGDLIPIVVKASRTMLKRLQVAISGDKKLVPLDIDVFPQDNSNTSKEGVSWTYKHFDGYAPIAAYLGHEGWCLEVELRPGSQHCQAGFVPFLKRVLASARELTRDTIVVRLDAGHDAVDTLVALDAAEHVHYIVKWNPRGSDVQAFQERVFAEGCVTSPRAGKRVGLLAVEEQKKVEHKVVSFKRIVRVTERTMDAHGQMLLVPEVTLDGWWTDLNVPINEVIELYRAHATSEQFHSEFKSDLDLERLPSGKFATNALIMALGGFAYNILRAIGQMGLLGQHAPIRHPAKRRRIKTVIQELIYLAARLIHTGRRLMLRFSRHCPAFEAYRSVYNKLLPAQ
jgi:hypothetical protein